MEMCCQKHILGKLAEGQQKAVKVRGANRRQLEEHFTTN